MSTSMYVFAVCVCVCVCVCKYACEKECRMLLGAFTRACLVLTHIYHLRSVCCYGSTISTAALSG